MLVWEIEGRGQHWVDRQVAGHLTALQDRQLLKTSQQQVSWPDTRHVIMALLYGVVQNFSVADDDYVYTLSDQHHHHGDVPTPSKNQRTTNVQNLQHNMLATFLIPWPMASNSRH